MLNLLVILSIALVGRQICQRLKQPIILGELIAGIMIANMTIVQITEPISFIARLGILILLFSTGLALDLDELKRLGKSSAAIAFTGAFFPFAFGYTLAVLLGFSLLPALFIGSTLIATSVGINAEILSELKMLKTRLGTIIMGSAVFDDMIGILALGLLGGLVAGSIILREILLLIVLTIIFFVLSIVFISRVVKRLLRRVVFKTENLIIFGLIIALLYALVAKQIGLELLMGAFLAGLVLGQAHYSRDLLENFSVFGESFFIPVFFVTIGMRFELGALASAGLFAVLLTIIAISGKIIGCFLGGIISRLKKSEALAIGIAMVPRAEVALIIMGIGLANNLIEKNIASAILAMVIVTTFIVPPILTRTLKKTAGVSRMVFN